MSIFVIRHGETASNASGVVQHPETPLSERGLAQARLLGERLAGVGVARILSSDYARASMTADQIRDATGAPMEFDATLRERNYGDLRGRPYTEVGQYIWMEGYEPPGGESWEVFHTRVDRAWEGVRRAAAETDGNLAVVTHGLVCYSLLARHLALPDGASEPTRFGNTALTVVDAEPPWSVRLVACCAHLDEAAADDARRPSGI